MPPYDLINWQYWLLMTGAGLILAIGVILARNSRYLRFSLRRRRPEELERTTAEFESGFKERDAPMPLLIWLLIAAYLAWAVGYTVYSGMYGL